LNLDDKKANQQSNPLIYYDKDSGFPLVVKHPETIKNLGLMFL